MNFVRRTIPVGPLQSNCTILGDTESRIGWVFDAGGDGERILGVATKLGLDIKGIIQTHAHLDHIMAAGYVHKQTAAPIWLHSDDRFLWDGAEQQCAAWGLPYSPLPEPTFELTHGQGLEAGCVCIHTPGHTPGGCCFHFPGQQLLVAGDTLFRGSVGRSDLPGGNGPQLMSSIRNRLYPLDDATVVVAGHGPDTTIGHEKRFNAFVRLP